MKINLINKPLLVTPQQLENAMRSIYLPHKNFLPNSNIALIQVEGLLTHREHFYGSSYEEIQLELNEALDSTEIEHIVFEINSGGGEVNGLFDLVDEIIEARNIKPITAFVNEHAYSAAYLIATSANQIILPRTGSIGSMGVMVAHVDQSEAEKKAGFTITEVYSGKHKVDFSPHQPLSDIAKADLQEQIDETYELLIQTLARNRQADQSLFRSTDAQIYSSSKALELNLVDRIQSFNKFREEIKMENQTQSEVSKLDEILAQERTRVKSIMNLCRVAKHQDFASDLIEQGASLDDARKYLFERLVASSGESIVNTIGEKQSDNNLLINSMVRGLGGV